MLSELVSSLAYTVDYIVKQVADLNDEEIVSQPTDAPNHAAWTLGHITFSCQEITAELGIERWLPGDWESQFGYGSVPASQPSPQLNKAVLLASLQEASSRLRTALIQLDEKTLTAPLPDEEFFVTKGHVLLHVIAAHTAFHAGQMAAWRRAIGRPPVEVFV